MKFKINEVFCSIQGEGIMVGTPMNFIRFTKCNRECLWCDTDFQEGREMEIGEILERLNPKIKWVSLTGGEPTMERNLLKLMKRLKKEGYKIFLETNATKFNEKIFSESNFVSIDLKPPSSGNPIFEKKVLLSALENPKKTQLKVVIQKKEDLKFFSRIYGKNKSYENWVLQPEWKSREKLNYKEIMREFPKVRIIPQIHKILKLE